MLELGLLWASSHSSHLILNLNKLLIPSMRKTPHVFQKAYLQAQKLVSHKLAFLDITPG